GGLKIGQRSLRIAAGERGAVTLQQAIGVARAALVRLEQRLFGARILPEPGIAAPEPDQRLDRSRIGVERRLIERRGGVVVPRRRRLGREARRGAVAAEAGRPGPAGATRQQRQCGHGRQSGELAAAKDTHGGPALSGGGSRRLFTAMVKKGFRSAAGW